MAAPVARSEIDATATSRKGMTLDWLETASLWSNIAVVVLGVLAAIAGGFALFFGLKLGAIKDADQQQLELRVAAQQERAAKAEKDLLELQERARPRTVDSNARSAMIDVLKSTRSDGPVEIEFIGGSTSEPFEFTTILVGILKEAGWVVGQPDGGPALGNPPTGLLVKVSQTGEPPERALVLQSAMTAGGIPTRLSRHPSVKLGEVVLLVRLKP